MSHTPTPWVYGVYEITDTMRQRLEKPQSCVCLPNDPNRVYDPAHGPMMVIALCGDATDENSKADVELIVRAVNCHEELLQALKQLSRSVPMDAANFNMGGAVKEGLRMAKEAIAKAEVH